MSKSSRVAAAVAAGYVLGRFKKLRMAVMVGSAMANDNVRQSVMGAVRQGSGRLGTSSAGQTLAQKAGSKLLDAGKAAAVAAAASRVDAFSDRLAARRENLGGEDQEATAEDDAEEEEEEEEEPEDEDEAEPEDEEELEDEYEEPLDEDEEPAGDDEEEELEGDEEEEEDVARSSRRGRSASSSRRSGS